MEESRFLPYSPPEEKEISQVQCKSEYETQISNNINYYWVNHSDIKKVVENQQFLLWLI